MEPGPDAGSVIRRNDLPKAIDLDVSQPAESGRFVRLYL